MNRNNYIQNKSLRTFLTASILISVMSQVNTFIDGVIVNHFVSPDALSTVSLMSPVLFIIYIFFDMVSRGASILIIGEMGMQHYDEVPKYFTSSMLITFVVTSIMALVAYLFSDTIENLLTTNARLLPLLHDYLPIALLGSVVTVVYYLVVKISKWTGRPDLATEGVIVVCASNILLDLLLVAILGLGMKGAAWATNISVLVGLCYLLFVLHMKAPIARMMKPKNQWLFQYGTQILSHGLPTAVGSVSTATLLAMLNYLVLKSQGADGMFTLSVGMQMLIMCNLVFGSAGCAITNVGGVMLGEGDIDAYRSFINSTMKKAGVILFVITAALAIYPEMVAYLFDANEEIFKTFPQAMRVLCFSLLPFAIVRLFSANFQQQGHRKLCTFIMSQYLVSMIPIVYISAYLFPEYLWHSITLGFWIVFLVMVASTLYISQEQRYLHWFTLIPVLPNAPSLSLSISYDRQSVQEALDKIHTFLNICDLKHDMYYKIDSCIEEITYNIISMNEGLHKKGSFDIRVVDDGTKILVSTKDDGLPFNPIVRRNASNETNVEDADIPIVILNSLCSDLKYKFINGINCVYMNFPYTE